MDKVLVHRAQIAAIAVIVAAMFLLCPETAWAAGSGTVQSVAESPSLTGLVSLGKNLVKLIGGILMVFGVIQVGLTIKDGTAGGGQLSGAVTMIVAGGIIAAVAGLVPDPA